MATEAIKDKISKLLALSQGRGATEAEAATAMAFATKLMIQNGLTAQDFEQSKFSASRSEKTELDHTWQEIIAVAAGLLFGCKVILTTQNGFKGFVYIGRRENHEAANATFNYLCDQVERLYKANLVPGWPQSTRAQFRRTFKYACAARIQHRAGELVDEMKKNDNAAVTGTTALVVRGYFDQLADEVDEFLKETIPNLGKAKQLKHKAGIGTRAGLAAGNNVDLRRNLT